MIGVIGFTLLMIGAGGMDSPNIIVPTICTLAGLMLLAIEAKKTVR